MPRKACEAKVVKEEEKADQAAKRARQNGAQNIKKTMNYPKKAEISFIAIQKRYKAEKSGG